MSHRVGTKGQVVIEKDIRDRLGIQPGWIAAQRIVDDHVEMYFIPPEHTESLFGILSDHTNVTIPEEEFHEAREQAWAAHVLERFGGRIQEP